MKQFDHERLVCREAIELVVLANDVVEPLPRGRGYLADQLQRAATSVADSRYTSRHTFNTTAIDPILLPLWSS